MAFIYYKRVRKNGRTYIYPEIRESRRVPGKKNPESVTLARIGGSTRKAADERYREVLRENVYLFGKSRPGERYAREEWAREQYHRRLDELNGKAPPPEPEKENPWKDLYKEKADAPIYRARNEQHMRKQAAEEELARAKPTTPPAPNYQVDDEIEAREAAKEAAIEE